MEYWNNGDRRLKTEDFGLETGCLIQDTRFWIKKRNSGVKENWSYGMMEWWNIGK
jgi:hypothetical protein